MMDIQFIPVAGNQEITLTIEIYTEPELVTTVHINLLTSEWHKLAQIIEDMVKNPDGAGDPYIIEDNRLKPYPLPPTMN